MVRYSVGPRTRKYAKEYGFLLITRNLADKYGKKLLDTAAKNGLDAAKAAFVKAVHETAETTIGTHRKQDP